MTRYGVDEVVVNTSWLAEQFPGLGGLATWDLATQRPAKHDLQVKMLTDAARAPFQTRTLTPHVAAESRIEAERRIHGESVAEQERRHRRSVSFG